MNIKSGIKKIILSLFGGKLYIILLNIRVLKQIITVFVFDFMFFFNNSSIFYNEIKNDRPSSARNIGEIEARLLFNVHKIEKGLSNKNLKFNFGNNVIREICELIIKGEEYSVSDNTIKYSVATLKEYDKIHRDSEKNHSFSKDELFNKIIESSCASLKAGVTEVIGLTKDKDYSAVVKSRVSCREFTETRIGPSRVEKAVELALKTPSVCNRQIWKVHYFEGSSSKKVLSLQNGNSSFSDYINEVLLISVDIRGLLSPFERNQGFVDGGLFAMSVINALHYYDIASCPLNWASSIEQNKFVNTKSLIPKNESIIMAIAIGNYPEKFSYPVSLRKPIKDVFFVSNNS